MERVPYDIMVYRIPYRIPLVLRLVLRFLNEYCIEKSYTV